MLPRNNALFVFLGCRQSIYTIRFSCWLPLFVFFCAKPILISFLREKIQFYSTSKSYSNSAQNKIIMMAATGNCTPFDSYQKIPNILKCKICGFQNHSRFHFNSHLNTHTYAINRIVWAV